MTAVFRDCLAVRRQQRTQMRGTYSSNPARKLILVWVVKKKTTEAKAHEKSLESYGRLYIF